MTKKLLLIAVFAICFISCKKVTNKSDNTKLQKQIVVDGFNFDQFGISHNSYLDYVQQAPNFLSLTAEERFNYGLTYNDSYFGSWQKQETWTYLQSALSYDNTIVNLMMNGNDISPTLIQDTLADSTTAPYLDSIAHIFHDAGDSTHHPMYSVAAFTARIESLESQILANVNIQFDQSSKTGNDGAELLAVCAIAKYSYSYWYNIASNPNPPTTGWSNPQFSLIGNVWGAIRRAATDVGAFLGDGAAYPRITRTSVGIGIVWDLDEAVSDAGSASAHT